MWFFFAFGASLLQASARLVNQYRQLSGIKLTFVTKILKTFFAFPLVFFIHWPNSLLFYGLTILTAPLAVYQDKSIFDFTARYGAGTVTRLEPLSVPVVFVCWLALHPALMMAQLQGWPWLIGIVLCIAISVACALRTRRCSVSGGALVAMLPLILTTSALNMVSKAAIDVVPGLDGVIAYVFIQSVAMVLISGPFNRELVKQPSVLFTDKAVLQTAALVAVLTLGVMALRLYGFIYAANPAYVTVVMLTGPFWIMLFYKVMKHEEKGDIRAGIGIVISAIILTGLVALSGQGGSKIDFHN